jgi:hypothetical protein
LADYHYCIYAGTARILLETDVVDTKGRKYCGVWPTWIRPFFSIISNSLETKKKIEKVGSFLEFMYSVKWVSCAAEEGIGARMALARAQ